MEIRPHDVSDSKTESAPGTTDELAARRELLAIPAATSVLVVTDPAPERMTAIRQWASRHAAVRPQYATSATVARDIAAREQPQVAVVDLLFQGTHGIALAVEIGTLAPGIEIVLVVADPTASEVQAAWDLGWRRLVQSDGLVEWLERGLAPLAQLAAASRQQSRARREAERLATGDVTPGASMLPLTVAEGRYRETYLRSALATAGNRREAARQAGVPYTTFCVMLRRLGIT